MLSGLHRQWVDKTSGFKLGEFGKVFRTVSEKNNNTLTVQMLEHKR
jgi:hypothetical protein